MDKQNWILTVGELNEYVRRTLAMDPTVQHIKLRGEISNLKRHSSGHWYFSLKDEGSRINCVMFRQHTLVVPMTPRDGMQVVLTGSVSLYVRDGAYQFYAENMQQDGLGDLYLRFEQLKAKLQKEGLFDAGRKRPLPLLPRAVGIVTSRTGAVLHDIAMVALRRFPGMPLVLYPVAVQGEGAAAEIARGIETLGSRPGISVLIVGRGGGSMEDLWAFNEEIVARAIYHCPVPVVSAVGHETDFTIADFVADMRAATPSMAAEVTVPVKAEVANTIAKMGNALKAAAEGDILLRQDALWQLKARLAANGPMERLNALDRQRETLRTRMEMALREAFHSIEQKVETLGAKLSALGPEKVLRRGYAIAMQGDTPVPKIESVNKAEPLTVYLYGGRLTAGIKDIERGDFFAAEKENGNPG